MQVELINAMAQGNADGFKIMMDWCEATQSKAILGGTLTSQTGANGNRALGDVHNEVRLDIRNDDASKVDRSLSDYLVYPIAVLNGLTDPARTPRFTSDTQEPDDLALYADALPKLVAIGLPIPVRYAAEKLKIPEPDGDEPVLSPSGSRALAATPGASPAGSEPATPPADAATAPSAPLRAGLSALPPDIDPTPVSAHTGQLAQDAAPHLAALIDQVRQRVDRAESLDALRDDLLAAYGDLDTPELTNVMTLAFACADLAGRHDAREE
jgi:phage gp29-like protein